MILADTSVWIDHLRRGDSEFEALLNADEVLVHPFVIGELALGNLLRRAEVLRELSSLPAAPVATHAEVMEMVDRNTLYGRGIGYVDAHLLAAVRLRMGASLWTRDRRLHNVARGLSVAKT